MYYLCAWCLGTRDPWMKENEGPPPSSRGNNRKITLTKHILMVHELSRITLLYCMLWWRIAASSHSVRIDDKFY